MNVIFAPDWRGGAPYQRLLSEALASEDVHVRYLHGYKRILPLARLLSREPAGDIVHLHWPEAYSPVMRDGFDLLRNARFCVDLALAIRNRPLVLTAHNLHAHNRGGERLARFNGRFAYQAARLVVAHSEGARQKLQALYKIPDARIRVIPHGDLSVALGPPVNRADARADLGIDSGEQVCLMFGMVEPYKGIEEMIDFWAARRPAARLLLLGKPFTEQYGREIESRAASAGGLVTLRLKWMSDPELRTALSAVDCVIFNYRTIFTSGAASTARCYGLPLLIPARLDTVDLNEPDPRVFRFDSAASDFADRLTEALRISPDYPSAAHFRDSISWRRIAQLTAAAYAVTADVS